MGYLGTFSRDLPSLSHSTLSLGHFPLQPNWTGEHIYILVQFWSKFRAEIHGKLPASAILYLEQPLFKNCGDKFLRLSPWFFLDSSKVCGTGFLKSLSRVQWLISRENQGSESKSLMGKSVIEAYELQAERILHELKTEEIPRWQQRKMYEKFGEVNKLSGVKDKGIDKVYVSPTLEISWCF